MLCYCPLSQTYEPSDDDNPVIGCGEPNLHIYKKEDGEANKLPLPAQLKIQPIDASAINKKDAVHGYISRHLSACTTSTDMPFDFLMSLPDQLWGLKSIPWGKDMQKYVDGVPDRLAYVFKHPVYDADRNRVREFMVLTPDESSQNVRR